MINLLYIFKMFECGHFCIKYILRKDKIRGDWEYSKSFMTLSLICKVMSKYYEKVECYKIEDLDYLIDKSRCISLLDFGKNRYHYIVIEKVNLRHVYYYDPMFLLLKKVKKDRFLKRWSHYCCFYQKK